MGALGADVVFQRSPSPPCPTQLRGCAALVVLVPQAEQQGTCRSGRPGRPANHRSRCSERYPPPMAWRCRRRPGCSPPGRIGPTCGRSGCRREARPPNHHTRRSRTPGRCLYLELLEKCVPITPSFGLAGECSVDPVAGELPELEIRISDASWTIHGITEQ